MADRILFTLEYTNKIKARVDVGLYSDDQIFSEIVGVSESIDILQTRGLSDSVQVTDDLNGAAEGDDQILFSTKSRSETPAVGDVFARTVQYDRVFDNSGYIYWDVETMGENPYPDDFNTVSFDESFSYSLSRGVADTASISESIFIQRVTALADTISVSEDFSQDITLIKAEAPSISESYVASFNAVYADTANISEEEELTPSKGPSDSSGVSEQFVSAYTKVLSESPAASDEDFSLDVTIVKAETPSVSESFAFEFSTPVADNGSISESAVLSYSKNPSDTASATDTGFILGQDYCGIDYFSDDYVGIKRTFT